MFGDKGSAIYIGLDVTQCAATDSAICPDPVNILGADLASHFGDHFPACIILVHSIPNIWHIPTIKCDELNKIPLWRWLDSRWHLVTSRNTPGTDVHVSIYIGTPRIHVHLVHLRGMPSIVFNVCQSLLSLV